MRICKLFLASWVLGFLSMCWGQIRNSPLGDSQETMELGRRTFNDLCTTCHGIDGAAGDRGPAMAASRPYLRQEAGELFEAIQNGIPGSAMPPMALKDEDAWRIVAWIRSLRVKAVDAAVEGDRDEGAKTYWDKAQCGRCHMIRGQGGILGPDLSNLGKRMSLREIRQALTIEKPHVPLGYRPVTIATKDGRKLSGVSKNEHNFSLQMIGEDGELYLFTSDEWVNITYGVESLMPTDYDERLSKQEFQNLLAFLSRLTLSSEAEDSRPSR